MQISVPVIDSRDPAPLNYADVRPVQYSPEDVPSPSLDIPLRVRSFIIDIAYPEVVE
jgi:hypothetical protein